MDSPSPDRVVAASGYLFSCVLIFNVDARERVMACGDGNGRRSRSYVCGLASISTSATTRALVVTGDRKRALVVYSAADGSHVTTHTKDVPSVNRMLHEPEWGNSTVLVAGQYPTSVFEFDIERTNQGKLKEFVGHANEVSGIAVNSAAGVVYSTGEDATVRLWSRDSGHQIEKLDIRAAGRSLYFAVDKNLLFVGTSSIAGILAWDIRNLHQPLPMTFPPMKYVSDLERIDENTFASVSSKCVSVWTLGDQEDDLSVGLDGEASFPMAAYGVCCLKDPVQTEIEEGSASSERLPFLLNHCSLTLRVHVSVAPILRMSRFWVNWKEEESLCHSKKRA